MQKYRSRLLKSAALAAGLAGCTAEPMEYADAKCGAYKLVLQDGTIIYATGDFSFDGRKLTFTTGIMNIRDPKTGEVRIIDQEGRKISPIDSYDPEKIYRSCELPGGLL